MTRRALRPMRPARSLLVVALAGLVALPGAGGRAQEAGGGGIALDLGTPVDESGAAQPEVGEAYDLETSGDWTLRCVRSGLDHDGCFLYQALPDESGNVTAEIELLELPQGAAAAAGMTILTPLGTLLSEGITMQVDAREARRYQFSVCTQAGCVAQVGLLPEQLDAMRRGAEARIRIVPAAAPDRDVILPISLIGVTAGYDRIAELNALHRAALSEARAAQGSGEAPDE